MEADLYLAQIYSEEQWLFFKKRFLLKLVLFKKKFKQEHLLSAVIFNIYLELLPCAFKLDYTCNFSYNSQEYKLVL